MRVLVASRSDPASINIHDHLIASGTWTEHGTFREQPVQRRGDAVLIQIDGPSIHDEDLSKDVRRSYPDAEALWFLSKHRAKSGQPSLTVHPIGNPQGEAPFGGQPEMFSPSAPRDMAALLRRLRVYRDEHKLPHDVTYEATHHGPLTDIPSVFVEIGSDETWYDDTASGQAVAAAIVDALGGEGYGDPPVVVGVGGGHYVPRQTDKALDGAYDFGHLLAGYAVDPDSGPEQLQRCIEATPGCEGVFMHKKGLKGPQRQAVKAWCEALEVALY